ncbi:MAG: sigma factor-like helix-turn-helix DNA-binding protein [Candidatus Woesearchaeota archaeon]
MNARETHIKELIHILKERYNASLTEIQHHYTEEETIPANIYNNTLTPLEATSKYLQKTGKTTKEIAKTLNRTTSTIQQALKNADKKGIELPTKTTTNNIPISAFKKPLSPAETIIHELHQQGRTNKEIAQILGKDQRNIASQLLRAKKKLRGEAQ